jgi:hypothetical protein
VTESARTAVLSRDLADILATAEMPADPFEAATELEACKYLSAELVKRCARIRAERVANAAAWAEWETAAELDKGTKPPPPPPPPPDPEPDPQPQPDPPPEDRS